MKSPMNMAPNKMVSPAKALSDLKPNLGTGENEIDPNSKFGKKVAAAKMKSPMQMSPAKMGSAYKMDKSAFKLKSAPVNMNTPGSVAKLAGVSPMKNTDEVVKKGEKIIVKTKTSGAQQVKNLEKYKKLGKNDPEYRKTLNLSKQRAQSEREDSEKS